MPWGFESASDPLLPLCAVKRGRRGTIRPRLDGHQGFSEIVRSASSRSVEVESRFVGKSTRVRAAEYTNIAHGHLRFRPLFAFATSPIIRAFFSPQALQSAATTAPGTGW
jgi:hypothetical protein